MKIDWDQRAVEVWSGEDGLRNFVNKSAIGRKLGIRDVSVGTWKHVPKKRVEAICEILRVDPHVLRPDLYEKQPNESI